MLGRLLSLPLSLALAVVLLGAAAAGPAAAYEGPPEGYASYQPQKKCRDKPRAGTVALAAWINARFDTGTAAASMRACKSGGVSEHKDGRAIDWMMDATRKKHRKVVSRFLDTVLKADDDGNADALARRMGVMYVIWNDHMYASYRQFEKTDYLSSSCTSKKKCSTTLRHRDHVHISLGRPGGRGDTSWYAGRL